MDYTCKYCSRDASRVGTNHYIDDKDEKVVCQDCADTHNPIAVQAEPEEESSTAEEGQKVDIGPFQLAAFEVMCERVRQITELGWTPEHDAHTSMADFLLYMENCMNMARHKIASRNPQQMANARGDLIRTLALGMAFLESHPVRNG